MDIGVLIFPTDEAIRPSVLAQEAEARGFESLWFPEHSHIPTSRATPWGGRDGAPPLPPEYWRTHDQFVALATCASVTERIRLCTGITLVAQRDPIWLAKEVATLDALSDGRVELGIGYGWNKEEMAQHGTAYGERRALLREKILMMKALWTEEEASYEGERLSLESSWAWPKPTQSPHPPIILGGGAGPKTIADVVEFCDGWMPIAGRHPVDGRWAEIRQAAEGAGRDPSTLSLGVFGASPKPEHLESLREQGVTRAVLGLPPAGADEVLPLLDRYADLVGAFTG
ncbi:MAG: LLM class F420-dependent oxidoreductase [Actinomycetota bacterium]